MRAPWLAVAAVLSGCVLPDVVIAPQGDLLVVELYLRSGATRQVALLHGTTQTAVTDASVVVTDGTGATIRFEEVGAALPCAGAGLPPIGTCYVADALPADFVRPGASYTLRVEHEGRVLTSVTTVPGAFRISEPAEVEAETPPTLCSLPAWTQLELVWTPSDGAWVYLAEAIIHGVRRAIPDLSEDVEDPLRLIGLSISAADTTMLLPANLGVFQRFDVDPVVLLALQRGFPVGVGGEVVLVAADRNMVNWIRGGNFNPSGPVRVASVGGQGTGVFGSLVARELLFEVGEREEGDDEVRCGPAPTVERAG